MSLSDYMRRLIDLANGKSEETAPQMLNEDAGSPVKNFSRWGNVNEAWGGEPGLDSVNVYQDKDPMGTGQWFWTRSINGHIVGQGSEPTEELANQKAYGENLPEDVLVAPELDEGGKMNAAWTAGEPPFSEEEQEALAGYKAGGGPAEGVQDFIASLRNGTAYDELNEPVDLDPEQQAHVDQFFADMDAGRNGMISPRGPMVDEEIGEVVHLLRPRGGSECGAPVDHENCTAEINDVTCPACIKGHDEYMDQFEMHEPEVEEEGFDYHLDKMFSEHQKAEAKALNEGIDVERVTGPAYWASYLVNGDDSGLEPEEKAAADAWQAKIAPYYVVDVARHEDGEGEDPRFTWSYDLHGGTASGGDVIDYICHKDSTGEPEVTEDVDATPNHRAGHDAHHAGVKWWENPHKSGSPEAYDWDAGHSIARKASPAPEVDEAADPAGYKQKDGTVLPYGEWHKVSDKISIMPKKTTYYIRFDPTGEIVKPAGPAGKDALMMALYYNKEPTGYAVFCFGGEAMRGDAMPGEPLEEENGGGLHVSYDLSIDDLPEECVQDCGAGGGAKDQAVEYWRKKLNFTVDRQKAIDCLQGYGAWEPEELEALSDEEIADKILWLACSNFAEWDGTPDSSSGSDIFVLE